MLGDRQSGSAVLEVEEREVFQSGQTRVESQGFVVRQLSHLSALNLRLIKNAPLCPDADRPMSSSHLSRVSLQGSSVRLSGGQTSPTLSPQKTGDHSISMSWSVSPLFSLRRSRGCPASGD